ncbi:MAG TPA: transcription elongation factor GreB [Gammaproteobacteria bacterium]
MGRYRPPAVPASKYITPEGKQRLDAELTFLWRTKRPQVCQAVAEAAAQGDRSENAEYIYGKKQLREIDARVRFLRKRLDGMVVVDRPPADTTRIYFGAWVRLEDEAGQEQIRRIVGPDEFDADPRYVSLDSPLAKALLKKGLDEEVEVELPRGRARFIVTAISYQPFEA